MTHPSDELLKTPLHDLHLALGARMVPFAGYSMPVQYPAGLLAEHHHTRNAASLFDVSHMGQLLLVGPDAPAALETLLPVDVIGLAPGRQRYGLLLNDEGGIMDDLMFVNRADSHGDLFLVVNGACKAIRPLPSSVARRSSLPPLFSRMPPWTRSATAQWRRLSQRGVRAGPGSTSSSSAGHPCSEA